MPQTQPLVRGTERALRGFRENPVGFSSTYCLFPESQCHTDYTPTRCSAPGYDVVPASVPSMLPSLSGSDASCGFNTNIQSSRALPPP